MTMHSAQAPRLRVLFLIGLMTLAAPLVWAQNPNQVTGPGNGVPPVPPGEGEIRGRIILPGNATAGAGLNVVLYALQASGQPGLTRGQADASGFFSFENVSTDPSTIYLVGTEYLDVPFGQRLTFPEGQKTAEVTLPLRVIDEDSSGLQIKNTTYQVDWVGSRLFIQASQELSHSGDNVIFIPVEARETESPLLTARLPAEFSEFVRSPGGLEQGLERQDRDLLFWGPIYPGDQEVRYGFLIDTVPNLEQPDENAQSLELRWALPAGSAGVRILTPAREPKPLVDSLLEPTTINEVDGQSYTQTSLGPIAAGQSVEFTLPIAGASRDAERLKIARADYWVEADDTVIQVSAEITLDVQGGLRLLAGDDKGILRIPFPEDAEFGGLSGSAESIGVGPHPEGGLMIQGPVPAGATSLGIRYRLPVRDGLAQLDLAFSRPVDVLNVLVADTGVIVESPRLHKRRPFRSGTRVYLHREAYQLRAEEPVPIALIPFERSEISPRLSNLAGLALGVAAAGWLIIPLRRAQRKGNASSSEISTWAIEREAIYENLRDLEHDHETGKVESADFERMRAELRDSAIELMRREKDQAPASPAQQSKAATASASFCTQCGTQLDASWRFCSTCGHRVSTREAPDGE